MLSRFLSILRFLFRNGNFERELDVELRDHIQRQTELNVRRGMTLAQAHLAATRGIGGMEQIKEQCREARSGRFIEMTLQDIRFGLRVLLKNPGFSLIVIVTLALGIGANTAIFSVVYGVLLRPLPYQHGARLVVLHQVATRVHVNDVPFSVKEIDDYRSQNHTLQDVVEHHQMTFLLLGHDRAERVQTAVVSANFFDVLGVQPLLGRTFVPADEARGSDAVLILSYQYWKSRHGGDPAIIGKVFQLNNRPHTVIGVLPPIPQYPSESDVYMPTSQCPFRSSPMVIENRQSRMMNVFARLKPGVPVQTAQADLAHIADHLKIAFPDVYPPGYGYGIAAVPLRDELTRPARATFLVLLGAAGFVLLIVCANVANLSLARLLKLERELAVRSALGASKLRLFRQLLTESLLLSLSGGALGIALAPVALNLLVNFAARFSTRAAEVKMDGPVLVFAGLVSILTGILFGVVPALASARRVNEALQQGGSRITSGKARQRLRGALVVAQVAVSFVLLIGAALMVRSFIKLQQVSPGFNPSHLITFRLTPNFTRYGSDESQHELRDRILRRVARVNGVESVSLASNFPFNPQGIAAGPDKNEFEIEGRPIAKGELATVDYATVSRQYFTALRQPLLAGRVFTERDNLGAPTVAVINQALARHRWSLANPIGARFSFDRGKHWTTIVGVVGDVREYGLDQPVGDEIYLPLEQTGVASRLVVRTASAGPASAELASADPSTFEPLIRAALREVDPQLAVDMAETIDHLAQYSVSASLVTALLMAIFALLALLISASGIAAVMALSVAQRTHELGIRMALGASRPLVLRMVMTQGLLLALIGTALGVAGAVALTRLLSSLLFATSPTDALTFALVSVLFLSVAALACFLPARQVTAIEPLSALRHE